MHWYSNDVEAAKLAGASMSYAPYDVRRAGSLRDAMLTEDEKAKALGVSLSAFTRGSALDRGLQEIDGGYAAAESMVSMSWQVGRPMAFEEAAASILDGVGDDDMIGLIESSEETRAHLFDPHPEASVAELDQFVHGLKG